MSKEMLEQLQNSSLYSCAFKTREGSTFNNVMVRAEDATEARTKLTRLFGLLFAFTATVFHATGGAQ